jgi:mannosyltransferase
VLCLAGGSFLRLFRLGGPSLWFDEAGTLWYAGQSWSGLLATLRLDASNLPLHYLLIKPVLAAFGNSESSLRLVSVVAGLAGILLAAAIGANAGGRAGAFASAWFWAFNPMQVWYSQDGRTYALTSALAAAAVLGFTVITRRGGKPAWGLGAMALTLGLMSHYYFVLVAGALVMLALSEVRSNPSVFRRWTLLTLASGVPLSIWLAWILSQPNPRIGIGWITPPMIGDLAGTLWNLASGYGGGLSLPSFLSGAFVAALLAIAVLGGEGRSRARLALGLGILLPVASVWVVSQRRPVYVDRYFIVLLPFAAWGVAAGAGVAWKALTARLPVPRQTAIAVTTTAVLLVVGMVAGWQVHTDPKYAKEDWRGLAAALASRAGPDPTLWLSDPQSVLPLRYYYPAPFRTMGDSTPPVCASPCWWVLRQPYTATHAFSQAVSMPGRSWLPILPAGCGILDRWDSPTGVGLWRVACTPLAPGT